MNSAITKISKRAKKIQRAHPSKKWMDCIKQASREYNSGRLGASRRSSVKRLTKRKLGKVHPTKGSYHTVTPAASVYKKQIKGVTTVSRSHTDKNKITANIQVGALGNVSAGTLAAELRRRIKQKIDRDVVRKYHATRKTDKRRIQKEISASKRELNKLST